MSKPVFEYVRNKDADQMCSDQAVDQCLCFCYIGHAIYFLNLKFQASDHLCGCTALLVSDQVRDSEGSFSPHMAHIYAIV